MYMYPSDKSKINNFREIRNILNMLSPCNNYDWKLLFK